MQGEKQEGKECYELCSEKFGLTALIGPIFRLQYLAGSIMQFIFPQADTNDLTQSQFIFYGVKLVTIYKLKRFKKVYSRYHDFFH